MNLTGIATDYGFYWLTSEERKLSGTLRRRKNGDYDMRYAKARMLVQRAVAYTKMEYEADES